MEGSKRTRAMQEAVDDDLMRTDTTAMDAATRGFFELRKKHALENLMEVDEERTRVSLAKEQAIAARTIATPATASNTEPATAMLDSGQPSGVRNNCNLNKYSFSR